MELKVGVVTGVTSAITGASTFSSSSLAQEMTVRLKRDMRIMYKIFFIFYFNIKSKILLVIRRTQNITLIGLFYKKSQERENWS